MTPNIIEKYDEYWTFKATVRESGSGNLQRKRAHCFVNQDVYVNIASPSESVKGEAIDIWLEYQNYP